MNIRLIICFNIDGYPIYPAVFRKRTKDKLQFYAFSADKYQTLLFPILYSVKPENVFDLTTSNWENAPKKFPNFDKKRYVEANEAYANFNIYAKKTKREKAITIKNMDDKLKIKD